MEDQGCTVRKNVLGDRLEIANSEGGAPENKRLDFAQPVDPAAEQQTKTKDCIRFKLKNTDSKFWENSPSSPEMEDLPSVKSLCQTPENGLTVRHTSFHFDRSFFVSQSHHTGRINGDKPRTRSRGLRQKMRGKRRGGTKKNLTGGKRFSRFLLQFPRQLRILRSCDASKCESPSNSRF